MKNLLLLFSLLFFGLYNAQRCQGQLVIGGSKAYYVEQIFVSNLSQTKDYLLQKPSRFDIPAQEGDVLRFSAPQLESKDVLVTKSMLTSDEVTIFLEFKIKDIETVVLNKKLTGNLKDDVLGMKSNQDKMKIQNMLGLPEAKVNDSYQRPKAISALPLTASRTLNNILSVPVVGIDPEGLYKLFSGQADHERRLFEYEKNSSMAKDMQAYFGNHYFTQQQLPEDQIKPFLDYLCLVEDIKTSFRKKKYMEIYPLIDKHLPIYLKRLSERKKN